MRKFAVTASVAVIILSLISGCANPSRDGRANLPKTALSSVGQVNNQ